MKNLGLTYCTNVHALGDWASWQDIIGRFGPAIREDLGWPDLPMGLWFPAALIAELSLDAEGSRQRIRELLAGKNLSAFTCNAFPFGNFHDKVVKTKVYHPDWTRKERLDYTLACARILSALVPSGGEGSVSTLPLGWRIGWSETQSREAARNLCAYAAAARRLADNEGRFIRLGIEPEPGCVLETVDQVLVFWDRHLRPMAKETGISAGDLDIFIGLCYDTCHQAVQFEDAADSLARLSANGVRIAKMQLSSALEFKPDPERLTLALRENFVEERFLHQTRIKTAGGVIGYDDLPQALSAPDELWAHPWRVHFHLPIDAVDLLGSGSILTTRDEMLKAYAYAVAHDLCRHFEVETYTWNVLPEAHRPKDDADLARSIAREIRFISDRTPSGAP